MLQDFNSHTPHGVRPPFMFCITTSRKISTHTPHTGCDTAVFVSATLPRIFQLTHPTRGATLEYVDQRTRTIISTHTPHTGCDLQKIDYVLRSLKFQLTHPTRGATGYFIGHSIEFSNFNSHTPHGVRQRVYGRYHQGTDFNSHTPHGVRHVCYFLGEQ